MCQGFLKASLLVHSLGQSQSQGQLQFQGSFWSWSPATPSKSRKKKEGKVERGGGETTSGIGLMQASVSHEEEARQSWSFVRATGRHGGYSYFLEHQANIRHPESSLSLSLPLAQRALPVHNLPWVGEQDHEGEEDGYTYGDGGGLSYLKTMEGFGTAPGAKLKSMLASLPGWFPSPPEGRLSAAPSLGRSLASHREEVGAGP